MNSCAQVVADAASRCDDVVALDAAIVQCTACPRLVAWCAEVATTKQAAYRDDLYWGRPVPGFGDVAARLLIVGLAPGAHGVSLTA